MYGIYCRQFQLPSGEVLMHKACDEVKMPHRRATKNTVTVRKKKHLSY
jgi:hypothetical protein